MLHGHKYGHILRIQKMFNWLIKWSTNFSWVVPLGWHECDCRAIGKNRDMGISSPSQTPWKPRGFQSPSLHTWAFQQIDLWMRVILSSESNLEHDHDYRVWTFFSCHCSVWEGVGARSPTSFRVALGTAWHGLEASLQLVGLIRDLFINLWIMIGGWDYLVLEVGSWLWLLGHQEENETISKILCDYFA